MAMILEAAAVSSLSHMQLNQLTIAAGRGRARRHITSNCFFNSYNLLSETVDIRAAIAIGSGFEKVKLLINW